LATGNGTHLVESTKRIEPTFSYKQGGGAHA